jgi:hypothetical protein
MIITICYSYTLALTLFFPTIVHDPRLCRRENYEYENIFGENSRSLLVPKINSPLCYSIEPHEHVRTYFKRQAVITG